MSKHSSPFELLSDSLLRLRARFFDAHVRSLLSATGRGSVFGASAPRLKRLCGVADVLTVRRPRGWERRSSHLYRHVAFRASGSRPSEALTTEQLAAVAADAVRALPRPLADAFNAAFKLVFNSLAAVSLLLLLVSVFSTRVRAKLFPPDLGKTAKWSASSAFPGTNQQGVGTFSEGPYFIHTQFENQPWLLIELGKPTRVRRIKVSNRADCCQERALPMNIEVPSKEGWKLVCQRRAPFRTWNCEPTDLTTDRIRIQLPGNNGLHLESVGIYP